MRLSILLIFLVGGRLCYSQTEVPTKTEVSQKIGHADWEYIFSQLPEYKQIEVELNAYEVQLQNTLNAKAKELEVKLKAYQSLPAETPEAIKRDKASEITYLQETMQRFEQDAGASMQKKQAELVNPILEKIEKAIETVAHENGYAYIVNPRQMQGTAFILFADNKYDISVLVLKKLGAEPSPAKKEQPQQNFPPRRY